MQSRGHFCTCGILRDGKHTKPYKRILKLDLQVIHTEVNIVVYSQQSGINFKFKSQKLTLLNWMEILLEGSVGPKLGPRCLHRSSIDLRVCISDTFFIKASCLTFITLLLPLLLPCCPLVHATILVLSETEIWVQDFTNNFQGSWSLDPSVLA